MWLLEASVRQAIEKAEKAGLTPTTEQEVEFMAQRGGGSEDDTSRILTIAGNNAEISIKGVLTKAPSFFAMIFGGGNTAYPEIISAIAQAEQNPDVDNIRMSVDSPGGSVDGLFDTLDAIQAAKKPITATVHNTAASAAFAIAAQADTIVAANHAVRVGSVGVVASYAVHDEVVTIASTKAPKKAPDVSTPKGVGMVREELDALHDIFVESIASGRSTTVSKVNADFGQGGVVLANEAVKRGMIDSVVGVKLAPVQSASTIKTALVGGGKPEIGSMDRNTLMALHPDVYAAVVKEGVDQERDRVTAHMTMGEASGDMKTASEAIKNGDGMTMTLQATYMTAGRNNADINARQGDADDSSASDNADSSAADADSEAKQVADMVCARIAGGA